MMLFENISLSFQHLQQKLKYIFQMDKAFHMNPLNEGRIFQKTLEKV